jgi:hypothetical protein
MIRPIVATLLVLAAWFGFEQWQSAGAARKLAAIEIPTKAHYEIAVQFPPEAFHVTRMQAIGRLIEVRGTSVFLMDVAEADLRALARHHWIEGVKRWRGL